MAAFNSVVTETQSRMAELQAEINESRAQHLQQLFQRQKNRIQFRIMTREIKIHQKLFIQKVTIPVRPTLNLPHSLPNILTPPIHVPLLRPIAHLPPPILPILSPITPFPPSPSLSIFSYPETALKSPPIALLRRRPPAFQCCQPSGPASRPVQPTFGSRPVPVSLSPPPCHMVYNRVC